MSEIDDQARLIASQLSRARAAMAEAGRLLAQRRKASKGGDGWWRNTGVSSRQQAMELITLFHEERRAANSGMNAAEHERALNPLDELFK